jgi:hypothetical protein
MFEVCCSSQCLISSVQGRFHIDNFTSYIGLSPIFAEIMFRSSVRLNLTFEKIKLNILDLGKYHMLKYMDLKGLLNIVHCNVRTRWTLTDHIPVNSKQTQCLVLLSMSLTLCLWRCIASWCRFTCSSWKLISSFKSSFSFLSCSFCYATKNKIKVKSSFNFLSCSFCYATKKNQSIKFPVLLQK